MKCVKKGSDVRRVREATADKMLLDGYVRCSKTDWKKSSGKMREEDAPVVEKAPKKGKENKKRMRDQKAEKAEAAKAAEKKD